MKTLVEHLNIPVWFAAGGASNAIPIQGTLPRDTKKVISVLEQIINSVDENELRDYREKSPAFIKETNRILHFTGRTWRPPYEASSFIVQVTSGCTHNKCSFCSLYKS